MSKNLPVLAVATLSGAAFKSIMKILNLYFKRKHIRGIDKKTDVIDSKLITAGSGLGLVISEVKQRLTNDAAQLILNQIEEKKRLGVPESQIEEQIAFNLMTTPAFGALVNNIFTQDFLEGNINRTPSTPATPLDEEATESDIIESQRAAMASYTSKEPEEKRTLAQEEEYLKRIQEEAKQTDKKREEDIKRVANLTASIPLVSAPRKSKKRAPPEDTIITIPPSQLTASLTDGKQFPDNILNLRVFGETAKQDISAALKRRMGGPSLQKRILSELTELKTEVKQSMEGITDVKQSTADILDRMSRIEEINEIKKEIEKIVKARSGQREYMGLQIDKKIIDDLIRTIPIGNRDILAPAIRGITGDRIDINSVISGLVGLAVSMSISPTAGGVIAPFLNNIMNLYGVNLRKYLIRGDDTDEGDDKEMPSYASTAAAIDAPPSAPESESEPSPSVLLNRLDRLTNYVQSLQLPRMQDIKYGVTTGALSGAALSGLTTKTAQGAVSGLIPGGIAGGVVGAITAPMVEQYFTSRGVPIDDNLRRKINYVSLLLPSLAGQYFGLTLPGKEVSGTGIVSGAGITEKKLIVAPDVIAQTMVQETQELGANKTWQPKSISPTTDILDVSQQEKYADDIEMITQFDYIVPTSEGAQGTVDTNPLKALQATADNIRYTDAGVYVPYILWNRINDTDTLTPQRLEKLALGPELPPMEFMAQDNEATFENVAEFQFANAENTAIEFLSPYANFSNVDNYWALNPDSVLYTVNP